MNLADLQDYSKWVNKTAADVLQAVLSVGGWDKVFPTSLPKWASRIRNYFNIIPKTLQRESKDQARGLVKQNRTHPSLNARFALSGAVYRDDGGRVWFQMRKVGAAYHYPGGMPLNVARGIFLPQCLIPIFKLISPDRSGGSMELIVTNPKKGWVRRGSAIGAPARRWTSRTG